MPEMKDDVDNRLPSTGAKRPVAMITAFPEQIRSSACALGGIDSFICKPFEVDTLRAAITKYGPPA